MSIDRLSEYNRGILLRSFMLARAMPVYHAAEEMVADFAYRAYMMSTENFREFLESVPAAYTHMDDEIHYTHEEISHNNPLMSVTGYLGRVYCYSPRAQRSIQSFRRRVDAEDHPVSRHRFRLPYAVPMTEDGIEIPPSMVEEAHEVERELSNIADKMMEQKQRIQTVLDACSTYNQLWQQLESPQDRDLLRNMQHNFNNYISSYEIDAKLFDNDQQRRLCIYGDTQKTLIDLLNETRPEVEMVNGTFRLKITDDHGRLKYVPLATVTRTE